MEKGGERHPRLRGGKEGGRRETEKWKRDSGRRQRREKRDKEGERDREGDKQRKLGSWGEMGVWERGRRGCPQEGLSAGGSEGEEPQ